MSAGYQNFKTNPSTVGFLLPAKSIDGRSCLRDQYLANVRSCLRKIRLSAFTRESLLRWRVQAFPAAREALNHPPNLVWMSRSAGWDAAHADEVIRRRLGNFEPVCANRRIVLQVFGGPLKNNVTVPHYQNAF